MKKVLFVHDGPIYKSDSEEYFGVDYNTNLKNRYLFLGDKVTFLTRVSNKKNNMRLSKIESSNLEVEAVPDFKSLKKYFTVKNKAKKIIKNAVEKHDIIVIRLPSSIGLIAWKYVMQYNKPFIIEVVACPWDGYYFHSLIGKIIAPYMYLRTKSVIANSQYVMYVSSMFLQSRYPTKGKQLSCSDVTLQDMDEDVLSKRLEKINKKSEQETYVLATIGALNMKYKGQEYVIRALKSLKDKGYSIEYHLVGGGDNSYLKRIVKKYGVEDNVKFIGSISHDKVFEFMKEIDIYIQPSKVDATPRVVIEALSTACPVIGSTTGGIPELIDEKFIFETKNVPDLIRKIELMLKSNLLEVAKSNFKKSREYEKTRLNEKRFLFYEEFLKQEG